MPSREEILAYTHRTSGNVDIKSIVTYHDRIVRTADLIGIEVPKTKALPKKKRPDSSSDSESNSSDSDSDASIVPLRIKKVVRKTPRGSPPPTPRPVAVPTPSQPPPVSIFFFWES